MASVRCLSQHCWKYHKGSNVESADLWFLGLTIRMRKDLRKVAFCQLLLCLWFIKGISSRFLRGKDWKTIIIVLISKHQGSC